MTNLPKSSGKDKKKFVRPFKVLKADPHHLQDMINKARENEKYWRHLSADLEEEASGFSSESS